MSQHENALRISAFTVILLLGNTCAQARAVPHSAFEQGYYVGAGLGISWGHVNWSGVSTISSTNNNGASLTLFDTWTPKGDTASTEPAGRLLVGYQFIQAPLYFSAELGGTFLGEHHFDLLDSKSKYTYYLFPGYTEMEALAVIDDSVTLGSYELNVDIKPGWLLTEHLLMYARAGLAVNALSLNSAGVWSNLSSFFGTPSTLIIDGAAQRQETVCGIRLGLGAEYKLDDHLGITVDYIYTDYGTLRTKAENAKSGDNSGNNQLYIQGMDAPEVDVSTQSGMLSLIYHW